MVKPLYYCLVLPVPLLAALCTDSKISFNFVCIGNSVEVFQNVTSTILKSEYVLYKVFGNKSETIALWVMQNFSTKATIHPKYSQKVSLENGTILLQDFRASDEATYVMLYQDSRKKKEVQLCVPVPPTLRCKLHIIHDESYLIAHLDNPEYCGKPLVSVRWMEHPGIVDTSKSIIELPPGNEAGTYRACLEGETLKCLKSSSEWDICKNVTIRSGKETVNQAISGMPQWKTDTIVLVTLVALVLLGVIALVIKFWIQCGIGSKDAANVNGGQTTNSQPTRQDDGAECGIGSKDVANVNGGQRTNSRPMRQDDGSDSEAGQADQEIVPLVKDGDIALQQMSSVHHHLET